MGYHQTDQHRRGKHSYHQIGLVRGQFGNVPEEQWLALARQWMEKGDARMALRAWFLACLALLGGRDLLSISRYKSNLDYRRELARRARSIPGLDREFAASVNSFETAWYGLTPSSASDGESFAAGFERIRGLCK